MGRDGEAELHSIPAGAICKCPRWTDAGCCLDRKPLRADPAVLTAIGQGGDQPAPAALPRGGEGLFAGRHFAPRRR